MLKAAFCGRSRTSFGPNPAMRDSPARQGGRRKFVSQQKPTSGISPGELDALTLLPCLDAPKRKVIFHPIMMK